MSQTWTPARAFAVAFVLAFSVYATVILRSPYQDDYIDLTINMEAGHLQTEGLNPYAFETAPATRNRLRLDSLHFHAFVSETQERWDYYVSSNLPASTLLYAACDRWLGNPRGYRLAYSLCDALLAGLVAVLILTHWSPRLGWKPKLVLTLFLGPFNPVILFEGALFPEDKGMQVALMLAAVLTAQVRSPIVRWVLSPLLLGTSIAYKLFGVFIIPLCAGAVARFHPAGSRERRIVMLRYLIVAFLATFAWFVPFLPEVFLPLVTRFVATASSETPIHASMWQPFVPALGEALAPAKLAAVLFLLGLCAVGVRRRTLPAGITCLVLMVAYGLVWLDTGALNRYNIVMLATICLLGAWRARLGVVLACGYIAIFGVVIYTALLDWKLRFLPAGLLASQPGGNLVERLDNFLMLAFFLLFCAVLGGYVLVPRWQRRVDGLELPGPEPAGARAPR